jgi:hypothetical protein
MQLLNVLIYDKAGAKFNIKLRIKLRSTGRILGRSQPCTDQTESESPSPDPITALIEGTPFSWVVGPCHTAL